MSNMPGFCPRQAKKSPSKSDASGKAGGMENHGPLKAVVDHWLHMYPNARFHAAYSK
jgi:hypothetical protein